MQSFYAESEGSTKHCMSPHCKEDNAPNLFLEPRRYMDQRSLHSSSRQAQHFFRRNTSSCFGGDHHANYHSTSQRPTNSKIQTFHPTRNRTMSSETENKEKKCCCRSSSAHFETLLPNNSGSTDSIRALRAFRAHDSATGLVGPGLGIGSRPNCHRCLLHQQLEASPCPVPSATSSLCQHCWVLRENPQHALGPCRSILDTWRYRNKSAGTDLR